jgi:hypothetical protein
MIKFHDTQMEGIGLDTTYSKVCDEKASRKKGKIIWNESKKKAFYNVFETCGGNLPTEHLKYAAADAIATRAIYMATRART